VALIKELQSSRAKESQSEDITDDPIVAPQGGSRFSNLFFLNLGTADRTIGGKIFCLAKTATVFADCALRLLTTRISRRVAKKRTVHLAQDSLQKAALI
jgi:hypothetical protein